MRGARGTGAAAVVVFLSIVLGLASCTPAPKTVEIPSAWRSPSTIAPSAGPSIFAPSQGPSAAAVPVATPGSGQPSVSPSPSPGFVLRPAKGVKQASGGVKVDLGGSRSRVSFSDVVGDPVYFPPDGAVRITWADRKGNLLVIGGTHMGVGADHRRPPDVGLSLTLVEPQTEVFSSATGNCQVALTKTDKDLFAGTFTCKKTTGDAGTSLDAAGQFSVRF